jgi:hypothetical protein
MTASDRAAVVEADEAERIAVGTVILHVAGGLAPAAK